MHLTIHTNTIVIHLTISDITSHEHDCTHKHNSHTPLTIYIYIYIHNNHVSDYTHKHNVHVSDYIKNRYYISSSFVFRNDFHRSPKFNCRNGKYCLINESNLLYQYKCLRINQDCKNPSLIIMLYFLKFNCCFE